MRTLKFLLQKEFKQIFRSKSIIFSIVFAPIIQLILMPLAANYDVKNIYVAFVDHDHSTYSQKLINRVYSSIYFKAAPYSASYDDAMHLIEQNKADIIVEIPQGFEDNLVRESHDKLYLAVNAINGTKAGVGSGYLGAIIRDFNQDIQMQWKQPGHFAEAQTIDVVTNNWYNPYMSYFLFMVPGLMVSLLTGIGAFSASLNIVREKEIGTIEQINVTPIRKYHFLLGKLIPYWCLGMIVFTIGMLVSRLVYGIVPVGSIPLLYGFLAVYLLTLLGAGLLISTYSDTQQQAVSVAFFFVLIFNFISGIFTPIDSMPEWAKALAYISPISHFAQVMRMVVLKGSTWPDVLPHLGAVFALGVVLNTWAVLNYRKTT
ncbi:MAG: ABC transporter permease [Bacteroidetes bacterium]|nr:ABC transporter permease [Bacteroidota bacterium]